MRKDLIRVSSAVRAALASVVVVVTLVMLGAAAASAATACPSSPGQHSVEFAFTGSEQVCAIPTGVMSVDVEAVGAQGGGFGDVAEGAVSVFGGEMLYVEVGGNGDSPDRGGGGGFNGGGTGSKGGGGGGASDVRMLPRAAPGSLSSRLLVAAGGGGAGGPGTGSGSGASGGAGGDGGQPGAAGAADGSLSGGGGGTPGTGESGGGGGSGGANASAGGAGALGVGADAVGNGGAGGGGVYGGGGGGEGGTDDSGDSGAGGGGGGGFSIVPAGGTITSDKVFASVNSVVLSYDVPSPAACAGDAAQTPYATPVTIEFGCTGTGVVYTSYIDPTAGELSPITANLVQYTPKPGFSGQDWFVVRAQNFSGGPSVFDNVSVTVDGPPTADISTTGSFGMQALGTLGPPVTYVVTNHGEGPLELAAATLAGSNRDDFVISSDGCSFEEVAPGQSCSLGVRFAPSATGARSASLSIESNAPTQDPTITLQATGGALPQGPPGPNGQQGSPGRQGPQGKRGPNGKVELLTCRTVVKTVMRNGHKRRVRQQKCTGRLISGPVRLTVAAVRVTLTRGSVTYATGTGSRTRMILHPRRALRRGRYTLTTTRHKGKRTMSTRCAITIG